MRNPKVEALRKRLEQQAAQVVRSTHDGMTYRTCMVDKKKAQTQMLMARQRHAPLYLCTPKHTHSCAGEGRPPRHHVRLRPAQRRGCVAVVSFLALDLWVLGRAPLLSSLPCSFDCVYLRKCVTRTEPSTSYTNSTTSHLHSRANLLHQHHTLPSFICAKQGP